VSCCECSYSILTDEAGAYRIGINGTTTGIPHLLTELEDSLTITMDLEYDLFPNRATLSGVDLRIPIASEGVTFGDCESTCTAESGMDPGT